MKLHDLLIQRKNIAETFTKPFHEQVKDDLKYYNADPQNILDTLNVDLIESTTRRYTFTIPLVFTYHEGMMASMFDKVPDLIFNQGGKQDEKKAEKVKAAYQYLKKKLHLEEFLTDSAWWFLLSGFVSNCVTYRQRTVERPVLDEMGQPTFDEITGKPKTYIDYLYDDPDIIVDDPLKTTFSPESVFSITAEKVPYKVYSKNLTVQEIKDQYKKDVKPDTTIECDDKSVQESVKGDIDRVTTWFYEGTLPKDVAGEVKGWDSEKVFTCIFTAKEMLLKEPSQLNEKLTRILKLHGAPNKFYGFGIGKLLKPFQREKSIRRGQMVRFADVAAFPKLLLDNTTEYDKKSIRDPREQTVLLYRDKKPEYLAPPNLGQVVMDTNNMADQDAQQISGMMDISQGAQSSSTVDTATGQTIFADAAEKRIRMDKKKLMAYYKETVILLFKMCQLNWKQDKLVSITDEEGNEKEVSVGGNDLQDIDFEKDIDIDAESVSVNNDVLRQQAITLYDKVKDDPIVERKEVFKDMIRDGFGKKNPDKYVKESVAQPGTQLVNPQTGEQFVIGESGELTTPEITQDLRNPSGGQAVSTQSGVMASAQRM